MTERHVPPRASGMVAEVQRVVRERAVKRKLHVAFGEGRRTSDVTLVVVKGERLEVLRQLPALFEGLDVDQEVVRSSQTLDGFELMVALMRPRARRSTRGTAARRASDFADDEP